MTRTACGALLCALAGCAALQPAKTPPRPAVIAVPGEHLPHRIARGETSRYDGWVVPTPLMVELAPCFRDILARPKERR